ncbi:MAG: hypothetical protein GY938_04255 [Ketobacter sp.]|nr:hypothetical protein [Ketobacter sp.]
MKVFEVTTEYCSSDSKEIITERLYVTSNDNTLRSVVNHFTAECEQYEKELKGVREVLIIVQHIPDEVEVSDD